MDTKEIVVCGFVAGVPTAGVAGWVEYVMTGGVSGFTPLVSGLIGAVVGPLMLVALMALKARWRQGNRSYVSRVKNWWSVRGKVLPDDHLPEATPIAATASTESGESGEWLSEGEALNLIRNSSLTRLRLPNETITFGEELGRRMGFDHSPTASEIRADEIASYLLAKYNDQGSWTNRDGRYYKQYLEEWINEEVYRDYEATRSR